MDNVVALIGDNRSVNTSLARQANTHLVGCASHRLNLSVQDMMKKANLRWKK